MSLSKLARKTGQVARQMGDSVRAAFRGQIKLVKSAAPIQQAQVDGLAGETLQDLSHLQNYGFTSNPPTGSEAVIIPLGGSTTHGVIVATEHGRFRIKNLQSGETAIYNDEGAKIVIKKGKIIEADCDVFKINCQRYEVNALDTANFNTPQLMTSAVLTAQGQINGNGGMTVQGGAGARFSGNINQSGGNYATDGDVVASGKSLSGHTHTGDSGGQTSPPN